MHVPFIEAYIVLDKVQDFIGEVGRPQRSSEFYVL